MEQSKTPQQTIFGGVIHFHTDNSMKDATNTATQMVKEARAHGAPAVVLTDHGTMTGIFELMKAAKDINSEKSDPWHGIYDIKAIPGVEAYVKEPNGLRRMHMVLIAKDYAGYQAISRAVTASNGNIIDGYPCMNMEILRDYFAEGKQGHSHVIATSACVGGILAQILLRNGELQRETEKLQRRQAKYSSPNDPAYRGNLKLQEDFHKEVEALIARRDELKALADMKFAKLEKAISKMTGEVRESAEAEMQEKKKRSAAAADELVSIKSKIATMKRRETAARQACKEAEKEHERWYFYQKEIEALAAGFISDEDLYSEAKKMAAKYASIFGSGNFYIELQYHGIDDEAKVMPLLANLASELNLPLVACNDAHYARKTDDNIRARALVKAMRFDKWDEARPDDSEYYIKTDAELKEWLGRILDHEIVEKAMTGIADITNACDVVFPGNTHYPKFVGGVAGETSYDRLRRLVEDGIKQKYPGQNFPYRDRVEYELEIISKMQYVDYLCIVQDYLAYGRQLALKVPEGVGYSIGPGRGSAAGSLVCYLIGITSVDPMPLNLLFERFLNPDRVSSPDIDADLSNEVRDKVLEYVKGKYGEEAVCCIMTKGTLAAKAAVKAVARVRASEKGLPDGAFLNLSNAITKLIPKTPDIKLADCEDNLRAAFFDNADAQEIISDAMLIEGTSISYGMHAAGVIIADNGDVGDYIPLMWNSKKEQWCSQCDMVEAEAQAGLLKFDFLGLRNLDIITEALRLIKRNHGISVDIEKVPQERKIFREIFAAGKTNCIFQFESDGMKNLLRKFAPENLEHLILLNALFRPGPLQYADPICNVKAGKQKPSYICDKAKDILSITYGYPVYQEQIMQICNQIAGFTLGEADTVRRYMSKKKADALAKFKPKFVDGFLATGISKPYLNDYCKRKGIQITSNSDEEDAKRGAIEEFWEQLMDFAKYAFNKSHSAVYATIAYYTAWLKYHYPTEYMTAMLNHTKLENMPKIVHECRDMGLKVLPPDINRSAACFTGKNGEILFGLGNIKNVGNGANKLLEERNSNGSFRSFKELLSVARPDKRVCESLIAAGAFDCWCHNRLAMKMALENLLDDIKKINEKNTVIAETSIELSRLKAEQEASPTAKREKEIAKLQRKIDTALVRLQEYQERFDSAVLATSIPEDMMEKLAAENELLGMYVSGHPLDEYPEARRLRTSTIGEANEDAKFVTFCGVVQKLSIKQRKKDKKPMAFFTLEDETGKAEICCFTDAYETVGQLLDENIVVAVDGRFYVEEETDDEGNIVRTTKKVTVEDIRVLKPKPKKILVSAYGLPQWTNKVYPQIVPYSTEEGSEVIFYDMALGEFRSTYLRVSRDILQAEIDGAEITEMDI